MRLGGSGVHSRVGYVGLVLPDADVDWLHKPEFRALFTCGILLLEERHDLFLGYSNAKPYAFASGEINIL